MNKHKNKTSPFLLFGNALKEETGFMLIMYSTTALPVIFQNQKSKIDNLMELAQFIKRSINNGFYNPSLTFTSQIEAIRKKNL